MKKLQNYQEKISWSMDAAWLYKKKKISHTKNIILTDSEDG